MTFASPSIPYEPEHKAVVIRGDATLWKEGIMQGRQLIHGLGVSLPPKNRRPTVDSSDLLPIVLDRTTSLLKSSHGIGSKTVNRKCVVLSGTTFGL